MKHDGYRRQIHEFDPVYDEKSTILILGSFPSVKSREQQFYYGHPQNRFWKILSAILQCPLPETVEEKHRMLLAHHIALWDVIASCEIIGSSDSSIRNVEPTAIATLLQKTEIRNIYTNGNLAQKLYEKCAEDLTGLPSTVLPSSSPANAAYSLDRLIRIWGGENGEMRWGEVTDHVSRN